MDHTHKGLHARRLARTTRLTRAAIIITALIATDSIGTATASATTSWETVKTFAPLSIPEPPPEKASEFPEDAQLGGVSGMAVNMTGAGGVAPGTVYTIGAHVEPQWNVARYSPEGSFELAWTSSSRCGPKAVPASTCPSLPEGSKDQIDVEVDQTTGNVYVFYYNQKPTAVREYRADGTGPIAEFGELDTKGTAETSPEKLHGSSGGGNIAVDDSGDVYVFDEALLSNLYHRLMVFRPQTPGDYEHYVYAGRGSDIGAGFLPSHPPAQPVLDSAGNVYVAGENYIEEYDPAQPDTPICSFSLPVGGIASMTVNPASGAPLYFSFKDHQIHQLSPCNEEGKFAEKDSNGDFLAGPPFKPLPQRGDIEAMALDPGRQFPGERSTGVLYAGAPTECPQVGSCPASAKGQRSLGYMLAPSLKYLPAVESESVTKVEPTSASLNATINPEGSQTSYVFQYLTAAAYEENEPAERFAGASEAPLGGAPLGTGKEGLDISVGIPKLSPDTEYRYRVIATNEEGSKPGEAEAFRTFALEAPGLPDGRAWELVSPVQKNGGEVLPAAPTTASCGPECKPGFAASRFPAQVSPDGDGIAYQGFPFGFNEGPTEYDEYVSTRSASGWQTRSLGPPLGDHGLFEAFALAPDLGSALLYAGNPALTPEAPAGYRNLFAQPGGDRLDLVPALREAPPNRIAEGQGNAFTLKYAGASADLSRAFFEANDALTGGTPFAPEAVDGGVTKNNLYEWSEGQLRLVNVLPGNAETIPGAEFGSGLQLADKSAERDDYSNAVSKDGSRVFWSSEDGQLYVREDGETTREIPDHAGSFLTASADGSKVLLSDGVLYDLETETSTDLSEGDGAFKGIAGQSEDLSHVYFVDEPKLARGTGDLSEGSATITEAQATSGAFAVGQRIEGQGIPAGTTIVALGAETLELSTAATADESKAALTAGTILAAEEENVEGDKPKLTVPNSLGGAPNLYAWNEGTLSFVGTLLAGDNTGLHDWSSSPVLRTAEASPNGRYLAFNSTAELTGIDSTGACAFDSNSEEYVGQVPCEEVFLYDSETGNLTCPSCNTVGEHPHGGSFLRIEHLAPSYLKQPRYLTDSGRLYFDSRDSLVPHDTNGKVEDVYQYEPEGVGSCAKEDGCISLISAGHEATDSNFLAMDESGKNVFFTTRDQLSLKDKDDLIDLYDAREGGGITSETETARTECQGEACQPLYSPPNDPTPGSSSFDGAGNVVERKAPRKHAKKHKKKRHTKKHAHKRAAKHDRGGVK